MGYSSDINSNINNCSGDAAIKALETMGFTVGVKHTNFEGSGREVSYTEYYTGGNNIKFKDTAGNTRYIKNTTANKQTFNVYDIIAVGVAAGINVDTIVKALNDAGINYKHNETWTADKVYNSNTNTNTHSSTIKNYLKNNGYENTDVRVALKADGSGYEYRIYYTTDKGELTYRIIAPPAADSYTDEELTGLFDINTPAGQAARISGGDAQAAAAAEEAALRANYGELSDTYNTFADSMSYTPVKQDYNITPEQLAELKVKLPQYSDQELLSMVTDIDNNPWINSFLTTPIKTTDNMSHASLEERTETAKQVNQISEDVANYTTKGAKQGALNNILRDQVISKNIEAQRNKDAIEGIVTGARAANTQAVTDEAKAQYLAQADEILKATANLSDEQRASVLQNYEKALSDYTGAQLGEAAYQEQLRASNLSKLTSITDLIRAGIDSEIAGAQRQVNEETSRVSNTADDIYTDINADASAAKQKADSDLAALLSKAEGLMGSAEYATLLDSIASAINTTVGYGQDAGTGTKVNPEYIDVKEGQVDEALLKILKESGVVDSVLSQEMYDYATQADTRQDIIDKYGLDFLTNTEAAEKQFAEYADSANRSSNKVFNQAQQAYLAAVTAGDKKTADALKALAQTAGVGKQNIYKTSALTSALNTQQQNANVGNNLQLNYIKQVKGNEKNLFDAQTAARNFYDRYSTYDPNNPNANTLASVADASQANSATGYNNYAGLYAGGMGGQTLWNDLVSQGNRTTNEQRNSLANQITKLNNDMANSNTSNSTTLNSMKQRIKDEANLLKQIANGSAPLP